MKNISIKKNLNNKQIYQLHSNRSAITFIVTATLIMAFQDAIVKLISGNIPLWQIFTLRSLIAIPLLVGLLSFNSNSQAIRPVVLGWALLRGLLIVMMYIAFYAALPVIDLSIVAAAYYTGPLFITLFAALMIGEHLNKRQMVGLVLGFSGVLIIIQPGAQNFSTTIFIPIASAVFYALSMVITRSRCAKDTAISLSLILNFCFIISGLVMTAVLYFLDISDDTVSVAPFLLGPWVQIGYSEWLVLGLLAILNVCIHLALAKAYQTGVTPVVAIFDYSYLIFAVFWGFFLLSEIPNPTTILGMILITIAGVLATMRIKNPLLLK